MNINKVQAIKKRMNVIPIVLLILSVCSFSEGRGIENISAHMPNENILPAYSEESERSRVPADTPFILFGRGMYPGDDATSHHIRGSGFTTVILSSFYINASGDVYSGDDGLHPIIHDGKFTGNKKWLKFVASLRRQPSSVKRIEILLEGRWYGHPPNTFDFIRDWTDAKSVFPGIKTGSGTNSTLFKICKVFKEEIGVDAICIDDESVYDTTSIIRLGDIARQLHLTMTLCPYANSSYWKRIIAGSSPGVIDAIYLQCYDGGATNTPGPWKRTLDTELPVYPIFLCRGAFSTCSVSHNSKTPDEISAEMVRFRKDYPAMKGGAIWQMADVKDYIKNNCTINYPASGSATSVRQYLTQLRNSLTK